MATYLLHEGRRVKVVAVETDDTHYQRDRDGVWIDGWYFVRDAAEAS